MNRILFFFMFIFCSTVVVAQKTYFLYLQSESKQGFFVKHGNTVLNATASGYLVIPDLRDSSYMINIGIQGKELSRQFQITIDKKDLGFLIMNDKDKELSLFNLQSLAVLKPYSTASFMSNTDIKTEKLESNPFNNMLAKAIDDSTIKEKPIFAKKEEKKPEPASIENVAPVSKPTVNEKQIISDVEENKKEKPVVIVKEEPIIKKVEEPIVVVKTEEKKIPEPVIEKELIQTKPKSERSSVKYRSESSTTEGVGLVFTDSFQNGVTDTIRILIPNENKKTIVSEEKDSIKFLDIDINNKEKKSIEPEVKKESAERKEELKNKKSDKPVVQKEVETKEALSINAKNNCIAFADEADFFELRKLMASEKDDEAMVDQAKNYFKAKCFTTLQVKNLGSLFLYDLGRYQFYNASYKFVSDKENFSSLESEFKDVYFIERFTNMLKN